MQKNIILYPNPERDRNYTVTLQAAALLRDQGFDCVCMDAAPAPGLPVLPAAKAFPGALCALCFGGDGTLLRCAKMAVGYGVPVLGVNMGHTGFLTQVSPDGLDELKLFTAGRFTVQERMMLDAALIKGEKTLSIEPSVNDIVISRGMTVQTISLDIETGGHRLGSFLGDGVIISPATGSTGYALSSGGPVIDPDVDALLVTPICAHTSYAHAFVLSPGRVLRVIATHAGHRDTFLSVDGGPPRKINPGEIVEASRSQSVMRMLVLEGHTFFDNVRTRIHRM